LRSSIKKGCEMESNKRDDSARSTRGKKNATSAGVNSKFGPQSSFSGMSNSSIARTLRNMLTLYHALAGY